MGICHVCPPDDPDRDVPDDELLDHLRVHHPAAYGDGPARWPDGGLAVIDLTEVDW